jgi:hypothetical protein
MPTLPRHAYRNAHTPCTDQVIGAILSGWRYDISGTPVSLRGDYETHLRGCAHCRGKQRLHRTVDLLLLVVTTLACVAFLLAALVLHRVETIRHLSGSLHVHLGTERALALAHVPQSITISLEAVAIAGVIFSLLLWALVLMTTPVPGMVSAMVYEHVSPELRERLWKHAA